MTGAANADLQKGDLAKAAFGYRMISKRFPNDRVARRMLEAISSESAAASVDLAENA
jgi:outer membrane protein assembly factor BamD (BamD/ComL family)